MLAPVRRLIAFGLVVVLASCAPSGLALPTPSASTAQGTASASVSPIPSATASGSTASPSAEPTKPAPSSISVSAIQRVNQRVGFLAGWTGSSLVFWRTTDAGATWYELGLPAPGHLSALRFIDEKVGWAIGFFLRDVPQVACQQAAPAGAKPCRGVVLRTTDGGVSWQEALTVPTDAVAGEPMIALQAVDGDRAWVQIALSCAATRCPSELRRTTDAGKTWATVLAGDIGAMRFASATRGWVATHPAAEKVEVRSTSDGGATWTNSFSASGSAGFAELDAATADLAWLLTRDGASCTSSTCQRYELWRTSDGGKSWKSLGNPKRDAPCFFGHLTAPLFATPTRGWLGLNRGAGGAEASGGLLSTNDGGVTWTCSQTPPDTQLLSAADPDRVWAVGQDRFSDQSLKFVAVVDVVVERHGSSTQRGGQ